MSQARYFSFFSSSFKLRYRASHKIGEAPDTAASSSSTCQTSFSRPRRRLRRQITSERWYRAAQSRVSNDPAFIRAARTRVHLCRRVAASRFPHGLALYRGRIVQARRITSVLLAGPVGAATWQRVVFCGLGELSGVAPAW